MTDKQAGELAAPMEDPKPRKKPQRQPRNIMVMEKLDLEGRGGDSFTVLDDGFNTSAEAIKWIKENGEDLAGKTLMIVAAQAPRTVGMEEAKPKITF